MQRPADIQEYEVECLTGDIDRLKHKGERGIVQGYARLSSYHPREVSVRFSDGSAAWFWESAVKRVEEMP